MQDRKRPCKLTAWTHAAHEADEICLQTKRGSSTNNILSLLANMSHATWKRAIQDPADEAPSSYRSARPCSMGAPLEAFEFQTRRSIARSLERLKLSPACRADQYNAVWALFANLVCIFLFAPVHSAFDSCGLEYQLHS